MGSDSKNGLRQLLKKNAEMLGIPPDPKTKDILLHCCVEDVKWVKEHLLVQLEGTLKRQCYLSYRDDKELGKDATDAINDDINSAANLLLVISQEYLAYSWHAYYVKMAHRKSIVEEIPLAVIFLDDVKGLKFPRFCQVQGCLVHHVLLQWAKGATTKQQQLFWQELATKHLNNKNVTRGEEIIAARKTVVSFTVPEKVGFIHSQRSDVAPGVLCPVRKQHSNVDSKILESQIIVEEPDGDRDEVKPEEHEKELSTDVKIKARESDVIHCYDAEMSAAVKDEQMINGNQMTNANGIDVCDSYSDTICRSYDKSRNSNRNNRCCEWYESQCAIDEALSQDISGHFVLNGFASGREQTHRYSGGKDEGPEVPVHEEIIEKTHVVQQNKDDIALLLEYLEQTATGTSSRHASGHEKLGEGV